MKKWTLNSWKKFPAKHLPNYTDQNELDLVLSKIKKFSRNRNGNLIDISEITGEGIKAIDSNTIQIGIVIDWSQ